MTTTGKYDETGSVKSKAGQAMHCVFLCSAGGMNHLEDATL